MVMLIGGMAYSTAGGIKFDRLILVMKNLLRWSKQSEKRFLSPPQPISPSYEPSFLPGVNNNLIDNIPTYKGSHLPNNKINVNDTKRDSTNT